MRIQAMTLGGPSLTGIHRPGGADRFAYSLA